MTGRDEERNIETWEGEFTEGQSYTWNPTDPSLVTRKDGEKKLEKWRLKFLMILKKGMVKEQIREEAKIERVFLQKIRSYEEGRGEGVELEFEHIPKIGEKRSPLYEGIIRID